MNSSLVPNEKDVALADQLNRDCHCVAVDSERLETNLGNRLGALKVDEMGSTHAHLFAKDPVFLARSHFDRMTTAVEALVEVLQLPAVREEALAQAPPLARIPCPTAGVFYGFDFHLEMDSEIGREGPKLIEINSNAGGALMAHHLGLAQKGCCVDVDEALVATTELQSHTGESARSATAVLGQQSRLGDTPGSEIDPFGQRVVAMFQHEYDRFLEAKGQAGQPLRQIAIVEVSPQDQFLFPELLLFKELFQSAGIDCVIADPEEIEWREGRLRLKAGGVPIDLVYNRWTDFYLEQPEAAALRRAYREEAVALTPSPSHHARYARKGLLTLLGDSQRLERLGVPGELSALLAQVVPKARLVSEIVSEQGPESLWSDRKQYFFKPMEGFGSRAAYAGAKLTRKTFAQLVTSGDFVAQQVVPPSRRQLVLDGEPLDLKVDFRSFVYFGFEGPPAVQGMMARLYRGQTTNLRTPGGGLATVLTTP